MMSKKWILESFCLACTAGKISGRVLLFFGGGAVKNWKRVKFSLAGPLPSKYPAQRDLLPARDNPASYAGYFVLPALAT